MKSFICCFFMAQADAEAESLMHATGNAKLAKLRTGGISVEPVGVMTLPKMV